MHAGAYPHSEQRSTWISALFNAVPVSLLILTLFYYWFRVADRYDIFLYGHTARGIPTAQPFDELTSSRYWMAGMVASGIVMLLYATAYWVASRLSVRRGRQITPPAWWRVWLLCLPVLLLGIPLITMTVNSPTLPLPLALACLAATLASLALALMPAEMAARRPLDLVWLVLDGAGLMPCLLLIHAVELPGRGLSISQPAALIFAIGGILASAIWLALMTGLRRWRHRSRRLPATERSPPLPEPTSSPARQRHRLRAGTGTGCITHAS